MKILITGAAGFIGSNASLHFNKQGHEVIGIDCFTDYYDVSQKKLNARNLSEKGITVLEYDLSKDDYAKEINGIDAVLHFAAQPGISSKVSLETYVKNNIFATHRLIETVKNIPSLKMFVNIATSSVYGLNATDREIDPPKPASYYGVTKLAAEQLVLSYQREGNLKACSTRLFSIYGPRERPDKLFPRLIKSILRDEEYPLFEGSEDHQRSYTFVGDIVKGFEVILNNMDKVNGEIFNFGTDQVFTTREAIQTTEKVLGKKAKPKMLPRRPGDQYTTAANITKSRTILGYSADTNLEEGIKQTVEWYKENLSELPATFS
jgi:UDP-glucuronate 4-epimerase